MNFSENDFDTFAQADGDSCKACMTGERSGRKVTQEEFNDYLDRFIVNGIEKKFEKLWTLINGALIGPLGEDLHVNLTFRAQPKSQLPKMRPMFYAILNNMGVGQNRAQLNLRLSDDKRPNDNDRKRKFGVKFSLHHKCKKDLPNKDMKTFEKNIKEKPKTFIKFLKALDDGFVVFKNYGKGIDNDYIIANEVELEDIDDLFLAKQNNEINFQEIHKSFYWDDQDDREIIKDSNRLSAECVKVLLKLYPLYLYAIVDNSDLLRSQLKPFLKPSKKLKKLLSCTRVFVLEQRSHVIEDNEQIHPEKLFREYVADAKTLSIGDNWLVFNAQLRHTVVEFCNLVKRKPFCNIEIITKHWKDFSYKEKKGLTEKEFDSVLNDLENKILNLGFDKNRYELSFQNMRDRKLETDAWKIESSHPLDFYYSKWRTKKNSFRFVPKSKYVCR